MHRLLRQNRRPAQRKSQVNQHHLNGLSPRKNRTPPKGGVFALRDCEAQHLRSAAKLLDHLDDGRDGGLWLMQLDAVVALFGGEMLAVG